MKPVFISEQQKFPKKVLVIGNYRQTITVIRSLARAGYSVIVGRDDYRVFTQFSRFTAEVWRHPDIRKSEKDFMATLVKFLATRPDIAWLFPVGEGDIACLARHLDVIPTSVGVVMTDPGTFRTCLDKFRIYEIVSQLGIPQCEYRKVTNRAGLLSASEEIGYPSVVKPNNALTGLFGKKALILKKAADLKRMFPVWPEGNEFLVLQRFASGYRHNCHFVADRGKLLSYFEQRVLRTDRPDDTGYGVDGIAYAPTAKLKEYCATLAEKLNYSGAGCAQFLVDDRTDSVSFLEINPRLDATCALPYYCGYDFPRMAMRYAEYRRGAISIPSENFSAYPVNKHGIWLVGDMSGWLRALEGDGLTFQQALDWLKQMAVTWVRGDCHMVWSWTDPLPACYSLIKPASDVFYYLARRVGFSRRG